MAGHSMYGTRARRQGHGDAPDPRPRGPAAAAVATPTRQQQYQLRTSALKKWADFLEGLIKAGIVSNHGFEGLSDLARLRWVATEAAAIQMPSRSRVALLVLDWAARHPVLSAAIVAKLRAEGLEAIPWTVDRVLEEVRGALAQHADTFWHGPSRICVRRFLATVDAEALNQTAGFLIGGARVRMCQLARQAEGLPHLGPYLAYCMVRAVTHAVERTLRDDTLAATMMSDHTSKISRVLPMCLMQRELRSRLGLQFPTAYIAYLYCEGIKILRSAAVLRPLADYPDGDPMLLHDINGAGMLRLLSVMADMPRAPAGVDVETAALVREAGTDPGELQSGAALARWHAAKRARLR